jgi:hypothetical protein
MSQENVPHYRQRHIGKDELSCNAIAAIDDVGSVVCDDDLRGSRPRFSWSWAATGSKENQPRFRVRARKGWEQWGARYSDCSCQECTSA